MRYFKPAAFLLLTLSGLGSLLPRAAMAASEDADIASASIAESAHSSSPSATASVTDGAIDSAASVVANAPAPMVKNVDLSSLLNSAQGQPNRALLTQPAEPSFSARSELDTVFVIKQAAAKPMTLNEFKAATRSLPTPASSALEPDEQIIPVISQSMDDAASEDLPSLNTEPIEPPDAPPATYPGTSPGTSPGMSPDQPIAAPEIPDGLPTPPPPAGTTADVGDLPDILFADPNPLNVPSSEAEVDIELNPVVTLDEAVELAYRNNQTLQSAILSLEQAEAAVDEATESALAI